MSDKPEKKPDASPASGSADRKDAAQAKSAGKGGIAAMFSKTPVMLGGVMLIEAAVLFAGFKFLGAGAKPSAGAEVAVEEHGSAAASEGEHGATGATGSAPIDKKKTVEVEVITFRAPNKLSGRTFIYDVSIYLVCKGADQKFVEDTIKEKKNLISDRVRTIIAQTDPEKLGGGSEPGLETLRRQVKYQLDQIVGTGVIDEVLVPRCIPFRTDF